MKKSSKKITIVNKLEIDMVRSGDFIQLRDGTICIVVLHEEDESYIGYSIYPCDGTAVQLSEMYDQNLKRIDNDSNLDVISILQINDSRCIDINHRNEKGFKDCCSIIIEQHR